jgi:hypothetical protein
MISRNRKRYTIYEPDYTPDIDKKYQTVYSKRQAKKLCKKYGIGAVIQIEILEKDNFGGISFWNVRDEYVWDDLQD